jgi:hypothetical protein
MRTKIFSPFHGLLTEFHYTYIILVIFILKQFQARHYHFFIFHQSVTEHFLSGLVRVQPVKFFSEWLKGEGFKLLTPLGESEKKPCDSGRK